MTYQPGRRILVLGGSTEAFALARRLDERQDVAVITSLAGRTATPAPVAGDVRIGGFGGPEGLARYLREAEITAVVDATHPFTRTMPWNAARACAMARRPRLRLRRPGWVPEAGDRWSVVASLAGAARLLAKSPYRRVFLTTGRTELAPFASVTDTWFLIRSIEAPDPAVLPGAEVLLARGPFDVENEMATLRAHGIEAVVTKNSGGSAAAAKLVAANRLGLPVVLVARPPVPPGPLVRRVEEALSWCLSPAASAQVPPAGATG